MPTYNCAVISDVGANLIIEEREIPALAAGEVLIMGAACGVCYGDIIAMKGHMPGIAYPRVPGHSMVGSVEAVGAGVQFTTVGTLVGVGWHHGQCSNCKKCRRGDLVRRENALFTAIHSNAGYAEYMLAPWTGCAVLPEAKGPVNAAPLVCAGVTCFNAMRNQTCASPGGLIAIQRFGGLVKLGIQFAKKMGYRVAAISTSDAKQDLERQSFWRATA